MARHADLYERLGRLLAYHETTTATILQAIKLLGRSQSGHTDVAVRAILETLEGTRARARAPRPRRPAATRREDPATRATDRAVAQEIVDAGYRALAKQRHPDVGGSGTDMQRLNGARAWLRRKV